MQSRLESELRRNRQYPWIQPESDRYLEVSKDGASCQSYRSYVQSFVSQLLAGRHDCSHRGWGRNVKVLESFREEGRERWWCRRGWVELGPIGGLGNYSMKGVEIGMNSKGAGAFDDRDDSRLGRAGSFERNGLDLSIP